MNLIEAEEITKIYPLGEIELRALDAVSLTIDEREFLAIMGPSGSGKSTFMNIVGCLDIPTSGRYLLEDVDVGKLGRDELASIRNRKIGFVFQGFNLLSRTSALENVELPMLYDGIPARIRKEKAHSDLSPRERRTSYALRWDTGQDKEGKSALGITEGWPGRTGASPSKSTIRRAATTCCYREGHCQPGADYPCR